MLLLPANQAQMRHGSGSNQMHMLWPPLLSTGMETGVACRVSAGLTFQPLAVQQGHGSVCVPIW